MNTIMAKYEVTLSTFVRDNNVNVARTTKEIFRNKVKSEKVETLCSIPCMFCGSTIKDRNTIIIPVNKQPLAYDYYFVANTTSQGIRRSASVAASFLEKEKGEKAADFKKAKKALLAQMWTPPEKKSKKYSKK